MDFIKVAPSATFLSVLEELHTAPGAPSSITKFFKHRQRINDYKSQTSSKKGQENSEQNGQENSGQNDQENSGQNDQEKSEAAT